MQAAVETPVGLGRIVIPRTYSPNLEELQAEFPDKRILELVDNSLTGCSVEIVLKGLPVCHDGGRDRLRFETKIAAEKRASRGRNGVAGYSQARWLAENQPSEFIGLLEGGVGVEFCGTVFKCRTVKKVVTRKGKVQKVPVIEYLIPFFPRITPHSMFKMLWIPVGGGDLDSRVRVAFARPLSG